MAFDTVNSLPMDSLLMDNFVLKFMKWKRKKFSELSLKVGNEECKR